MTTAYVSGPMRGKPNYNHDTFCEVSAEATKAGFDEVINPALNFDGRKDLPPGDYMRVVTPNRKGSWE